MSYSIKWDEPYWFYIFRTNHGELKFGVTYNLRKRKKSYKRKDIFFDEYLYKRKFDKGWVAYFYEQICRHLLSPFVYKYKQEWIDGELPIEIIVNCLDYAIENFSFEIERYRKIHLLSDSKIKAETYRQLAKMLTGYVSGKRERRA